MHKKSVYIVKNKQTRDNHITGQCDVLVMYGGVARMERTVGHT